MGKEIKYLKPLDHPNLMKLYGSYASRQNTTLVMEECKGKSIYGFIKKKTGQKISEE